MNFQLISGNLYDLIILKGYVYLDRVANRIAYFFTLWGNVNLPQIVVLESMFLQNHDLEDAHDFSKNKLFIIITKG